MSDSPAPVAPPSPAPMATGAAIVPVGRTHDALVFVPGMGGARPDQSSEGVAKRVAKALERACQDQSVRFELSDRGRDEVIGTDANGKEMSVGVRTILRRVGEKGEPEPILDVYAGNYSERFTGPYERASLFYKCMILFITLLRATWPVLRSLFLKGTGKSGAEKAQLLWAGLLVSLLWAYMGVLVVAVSTTVGQFVTDNLTISARQPADGKAADTPSTGEPPAAQPAEPPAPGWWTRWSQRAAVVGGFILAVWPNVQQQLSRVAILYLCAVRYLDAGDGRPTLVGDVTDILAHALRKQDGGPAGRYRRVNVVAYSFGSVITLDALFPFANPSSVPIRHIDTLFTVGCPFDIIRTYWEGYFKGRHPGEPTQTRWLNVYSPKDLLGSNFRNDSRSEPPAKGIEFEPLSPAAPPRQPFPPTNNIEYREGPAGRQSLLETFVLGGLRAHATYWDPEDVGATSWYSILAAQLYADDPILGGPPPPGGPV